MDLAFRSGFEVHVVALPAGTDPADAPQEFEGRLADAVPYLLHRVRLLVERASSRTDAAAAAQAFLTAFPESAERQDAVRYVTNALDLPRGLEAGLAAQPTSVAEPVLERVRRAVDRIEIDALAACMAHPSLVKLLAELSPDHFDSEEHRAFQAALVAGTASEDFLELRAELDARAAADNLDERAGRERILNLRERHLRRRLRSPDLQTELAPELQQQLARVKEALINLS